ncbi:HAMP domain-containing protein [Alkalispirochaeta americana]|uniref:histidine kinase n=1 Tax=Alkalispirochaeta americana TaxID=159291 RepID=A0A1N6NKC8_9SPIO|nr:HAMP domain-containing sensor histidine kinase [Alkalispirochaeta americana]SIP92491.1 HAMP domain-containing protein [Alkalispirochaeta americana]
MKHSTKIRAMIIALTLTPFFLITFSYYMITTFSREVALFREVLEWQEWVETKLTDQIRQGTLAQEDLKNRDFAFVVLSEEMEVAAGSPGTHPVRTALAESHDPRQELLTHIEEQLGETRFSLLSVQAPGNERYYVIYEHPVIKPPGGHPGRRHLLPLTLVALALVAGSLVGTAILQDFSSKLNVLRDATHRMAAGDITTPVPAAYRDEFGLLAQDLEFLRLTLDQARTQRTRMFMGLSHDLSTPLTTIKGYVEALEDNVFGEPQSRQQALQAISSKADLLQERIDQLIDFSRLESPDHQAILAVVPAGDYFSDVAETIRRDVELTGRYFLQEIAIPRKKLIQVDRRLMERLFENLYQNAIRYTQEKNTVFFRVHPREKDTIFELEFADDGPGFGEVSPREVFEPFRRGSHGRNEPGLGFGLTTVRSIAETLGFTVSAGPSPEGGASITVRGPLIPGKPGSSE